MDPRAPPARRGHHLKALLASSCHARLDSRTVLFRPTRQEL